MKTTQLRSQIPVAVFLLIVAVLAVWAFVSGKAIKEGMPTITLPKGVLLLIVGFSAGLLGGIIGTGGCAIMLPILHFWMGYSAPNAISTTLLAATFGSASGGYGHLIRRNLDKETVLWVGGFGVIGVLFGSWLFLILAKHVSLLGFILGVIFLWPAVRMVWEGLLPGKKTQREEVTIRRPKWGLSFFGFIIGILVGLVGLGGGYALVPGLIYLFNVPVYLTMGTSLGSIMPPAAIGSIIKLVQGFVSLGAGLILAFGTIAGAQVGAAIIKRFKPSTLKFIFGLYFLYVSLKFILGYFGIRIW